MSELPGVQAIALDNTAGVFDLSADTLAVLFFALQFVENIENWKDYPDEQLTDADIDDIERLVGVATYEVLNMSKVAAIGMTALWWSDTIPPGWVLMGSTISKTTYPELFDIFGYTFGGGFDMFVLPTMDGFSPYGAGADVDLGDTGGHATVTLSTDQLPAHNHGVTDPGHTHNVAHRTGGTAGGNAVLVAGAANIAETPNQKVTSSNTTGISTQNTGSNNPVNVLHPVRACNFIIYGGH